MLLKFFFVVLVVGVILMVVGQRANKDGGKFPNRTRLAKVGYWMMAAGIVYYLLHIIFDI